MDEEKIAGLFETLESIDDPALLGDLLESLQQRLKARQSNDVWPGTNADEGDSEESIACSDTSVEADSTGVQGSGPERDVETTAQFYVTLAAFAKRWRELGAQLENGEVALESLFVSDGGETL
jgi:hypothetical protein